MRNDGDDLYTTNALQGKRAVGVDVGGTKIAAGLVNGCGEILDLEVCPTPKEDTRLFCEVVIKLVKRCVQSLTSKELAGVGVAVPAVLERSSGIVKWAPNVPAINGLPIVDLMEREIGCLATLVNDGHAATLAEHWVGAGTGVKDLILMAIGTGVGGGIISNNRLVDGSHGLAGAFGWMVLDGGDRTDGISEGGWLENRIAGPSVMRRALELQSFASVQEVFDAAQSGNEAARVVLLQTGVLLGRAIGTLASVFDTRLVILAGGVGCRCSPLLPVIRSEVRKHAQPYVARDLEIRLAKLGPSAGVVGSAFAVFREFLTRPVC